MPCPTITSTTTQHLVLVGQGQGGGKKCKLRLQKMRCKKMQINANKCKKMQKKCNPTTDAHTEQFHNRFSTTMDAEGPSKSSTSAAASFATPRNTNLSMDCDIKRNLKAKHMQKKCKKNAKYAKNHWLLDMQKNAKKMHLHFFPPPVKGPSACALGRHEHNITKLMSLGRRTPATVMRACGPLAPHRE